MKFKQVFFLVTALILLAAGAAWAATSTQDLTINTTIGARAKLTMGQTAITFPDRDPDDTPSVAATQNPVSVTASVRTGTSSNATLTVKAADDLKSGTDTIGINNVTWTATGSGYVPGIMSKAADVSAGSWTGAGSRVGSFSYFLNNSWNYETGTYSATTTYTLTAP